jgi:hypothetical protein
MCDRCYVLQDRIVSLEQENKKLKRLVKLARTIIRKQREQLDDISIFTWDIICSARKVLSQNRPRGTWSLWKGRLEIAHAVYQMAAVNFARAFLELAATIQGL